LDFYAQLLINLKFLIPLKPEGKGIGKNEIRTNEAVRFITFIGGKTEILRS
jgi:hypothetical protein